MDMTDAKKDSMDVEAIRKSILDAAGIGKDSLVSTSTLKLIKTTVPYNKPPRSETNRQKNTRDP